MANKSGLSLKELAGKPSEAIDFEDIRLISALGPGKLSKLLKHARAQVPPNQAIIGAVGGIVGIRTDEAIKSSHDPRLYSDVMYRKSRQCWVKHFQVSM